MLDEKIVIESFKDLKKRYPLYIVSTSDIRADVETKIMSKCYDIIYGISACDIDEAEISAILCMNSIMHIYDGKCFNRPQLNLLRWKRGDDDDDR